MKIKKEKYLLGTFLSFSLTPYHGHNGGPPSPFSLLVDPSPSLTSSPVHRSVGPHIKQNEKNVDFPNQTKFHFFFVEKTKFYREI